MVPKIGLVGIGEINSTIIDWLQQDLPSIFPTEVTVLAPMQLSLRHFQRERNQYLADDILNELAGIAQNGDLVCLGITGVDLFSPGLNFVFGIASRRRALVSIYRLRPGFYGMPENREVFRRRLLTEAVHEIGHAIGLPHCEHPGCVMYFSNWIGDTDRKGPDFCYQCKRRMEIAWPGT